MRANIHYYIIMALVAVMAAVLPARAGVVSHSATFASSGWSDSTVVVDNTSYRLHTFTGLDDDGNSGAPMLPCKAVTFSVPYNATNFTVTLSNSSISTGSDSYVCYPIPQPIPTDGSGTGGEVICDSTIYHTNAFYPASPVSVVADGFFMGENHLVTVAIYPMQVNPVTRAWRKFTAMNVTLSYDIDPDAGAGLIVTQNNRWRAQDQQTTQQMVANPTAVAQNAPPTTAGTHYHAPASGTNPIDELGGYEYTVITTRAQEPAYKRLVAWKRMKGYTAGTVCVEDINNYATQLHNMYGTNIEFPIGEFYDEIQDSVGVIRNYLRGAKAQKGTRYVLMGGEGVPYRTGYPKKEKHVTTDYYYGNLTTNWNYDNDAIYGEYSFYENSNTNRFDYQPQLYIGRLVSLNQIDVNNYINKLLRYEIYPGNGDMGYLKKGFYYEHKDMIDESAPLINAFASVIDNSKVIRQSLVELYPTGQILIDSINSEKYGFISMHCHGFGWAHEVYTKMTPTDTIKRIIQAYHDHYHSSKPLKYGGETGNAWDNLLNKKYPNIMYSIACSTMPFNEYKVCGILSNGHSYTCGGNYGGAAYLGYTHSGYIGKSAELEKLFIEEICAYNSKVGEAEAISKYRYNNRYYKIYFTMTHNLMGDPEFEMWTDTPQCVHPIIARNNGGITVGGLPYGQTFIVSYYDNDGTVGMDSITTGNKILTNVSPHAGVMVYRHNYLPWIAPLTLQNVTLNSQYVFASSFYAGNQIDPYRTSGDVKVPAGTDYEVEFFNEARLLPGFQVEKGAEFKLLPSNY